MRKPEECSTTLQSGHLLYHSKTNNGKAGVGFLINRKWEDHYNEGKQHQPQSNRTRSVHNKALQTKEIDYILTNRPDIVTDVTVINQVNIGSDHRMAMSNIKLDVEVERKTIITKRQPRVDATQIGSKKIEFQLELRNRFETLLELHDIDTMSETITDMIQQSASRVAKATKKPLKSRISLPTRALMTNRREMAENDDDNQRTEYAEIC